MSQYLQGKDSPRSGAELQAVQAAPKTEESQAFDGLVSNKVNKFRLFIVLLLGFSSGLPLAVSGTLLQAWFTVSGISLIAIGALGLIGQPYIYKFLWAPFLDRYVPPLFGRRRGWLIITQLSLLITIAIMAFGNPNTNPYVLAGLGLLVAFLSASQDIAIDAYRTDILEPQERGLGSACYTGAYRFAMVISGGLALIIVEYIGWRNTYLVMAGLMSIGLVASFFAEKPASDKLKSKPQSIVEAVIEPLREFFARKYSIALLLAIILYKLGDAFSVSLATPFLIRELGFSLATVGAVFKGAGFAATLLGVFAAGVLMVYLSLFRALLIFGVLQALAILTFVQLTLMGKSYLMLWITVFVDNFCNGLGSTALVAFLMTLCDTRYTATQFALLTAAASMGRVFIGPIAGVFVEHFGWITFFFSAILLCIPGLLILWWLKHHIELGIKAAAPVYNGLKNE